MAIQSNGTNQYTSLDDNAALTLQDGDWCFEGWFKVTNNAGSSIVFIAAWGVTDASPSMRITLRQASATFPNTLYVIVKDADGDLVALTSSTTPGANTTTWQHLILQRSGNTVSLYVDGVSVASAAVGDLGGLNVAGGFRFFASSVPAQFFNGAIEAWKKWDRALTAAEISSLAGGADPRDYTEDEKWALDDPGFWVESVAGITVTNSGTTVVAGPSQLRFSAAPRLVSGSSQAWAFDPTSLLSDEIGGVFAWIKVPSLTAGSVRVVWSIGDTSDTEFVNLHLQTNGTIRAVLNKAGVALWRVTTTEAIVTPNIWHRIGLVQDGVSPRIKFDGAQPEQSLDVTTNEMAWMVDVSNADNGRVGCLNSSGTGNVSFFDGTICEVPVLSGLAPSTAQVTADYAGGKGIDAHVYFSGYLAGYYKMERGAFQLDLSGHDNHLMSINSADAIIARRPPNIVSPSRSMMRM